MNCYAIRTCICIAIFSFLMWGCKKENTDNNLLCKLSSVRYWDFPNNLSYINYEYDTQGRVIKETSQNDPVMFHYYKDSVVIDEGFRTTVYYLNASGLAVTAKQTFKDNSNSYTMAYAYNSDGYLTSIQQIFTGIDLNNGNGAILKDTNYHYFTIQNGNLIKRIDVKPAYVVNYVYSTELVNDNIANVINQVFYLFPASFLGKSSKNKLIKKIDEFGYTIYNISYKYDSNGNIITMTQSDSTGLPILNHQFDYQCN